MKITIKIIMLLLLGLFAYLSLLHLFSIDKPTMGAYWLTIFTISMLILYIFVFFLDLEIISKWVSIKQRMNTLGKQQKELKRLSTAIYNLLLINVASRNLTLYPKKMTKKHHQIRNEIELYLNMKEIGKFMDELIFIQKNPK